MRPVVPLAVVPLAILCASLVSACYGPPDRAELLVNTYPPGASCLLSRGGQSLATLAPTPAIALLDPAPATLAVACSRPGFADAALLLPAASAAIYERRVDIALAPYPPFPPAP